MRTLAKLKVLLYSLACEHLNKHRFKQHMLDRKSCKPHNPNSIVKPILTSFQHIVETSLSIARLHLFHLHNPSRQQALSPLQFSGICQSFGKLWWVLLLQGQGECSKALLQSKRTMGSATMCLFAGHNMATGVSPTFTSTVKDSVLYLLGTAAASPCVSPPITLVGSFHCFIPQCFQHLKPATIGQSHIPVVLLGHKLGDGIVGRRQFEVSAST